MVAIFAKVYGLPVHYAGPCAKGGAQYWPDDQGVRIEARVLEQLSFNGLKLLAAHEVGHAWSARRFQAVPLEAIVIVLAMAGCGIGFPGGLAITIVATALGSFGFRARAVAHAVEEIRADWFSLEAGCTAADFELASQETAQAILKNSGLKMKAQLAVFRRNERLKTRFGVLQFAHGALIWLPRIRSAAEWRRPLILDVKGK